MATPDPRIDLSREQLLAVGSPQARLYVEAPPGSGKTTVSAQRFGLHRFARTADHRAVIAVSFTRSATAEIRNRVLEYWGPTALAWPHRIVTLDTLVHQLLNHLLRSELLQWPGGHLELRVLDSWQSHLPSIYAFNRPVLELHGNRIAPGIVRESRRSPTIEQEAFETAVSEGTCTHEDVRSVLAAALDSHTVRTELATFLARSVRSLIIDEIFDANLLDLQVVTLAARAGLAVTLVGDPWQALYGFRGARPEQVPILMDHEGFTRQSLHTSFRFTDEPQRLLTRRLRRKEPAVVDDGDVSQVNVVLARKWDALWDTDPRVLPLAIRSPSGQFQEAATTLLLSLMTDRAFGIGAVFANDALTALGITDSQAITRLQPRLQTILDSLAGDEDLDAVRNALNTTIATESSRKTPKRDRTHIARLENLRARLRLPDDQLIPGLTCHQAKGREWDRVGVHLEEPDREALRAGLDHTRETHRMLYVALTRGRLLSLAV
jgi:DNA helicase-2/ATP-dependent DNA helicase PcrA